MFGRTFYHDTLRRYVILFGTLFNDVWINREDENGNVKQSIKVPLAYGPREKFLARIEGIESQRDPLQQPFSMVLPRMGFEITGFNYAPERKLPTRKHFAKSNNTDEDKDNYIYNPVPYDISFSLSIFVKNTTDGTRIIEQILPYFTPEWTSTVQLIDDPDVTLDIPLVLTGTNQDDVYEGSFEERRALIWTLDFTMKGFFFGPVYKQEVIKLANTQIFDASLYDDIDDAVAIPPSSAVERYINTVGQLSSGEATTYTNLNAEQATAIATITDGEVTDITIVNSGAGYSTATVTITGGAGNGATATAVVNTRSDSIYEITLTAGGSNYSSTPTVEISAPDLISVAANTISSEETYGIASFTQRQEYE